MSLSHPRPRKSTLPPLRQAGRCDGRLSGTFIMVALYGVYVMEEVTSENGSNVTDKQAASELVEKLRADDDFVADVYTHGTEGSIKIVGDFGSWELQAMASHHYVPRLGYNGCTVFVPEEEQSILRS